MTIARDDAMMESERLRAAGPDQEAPRAIAAARIAAIYKVSRPGGKTSREGTEADEEEATAILIARRDPRSSKDSEVEVPCAAARDRCSAVTPGLSLLH